MKNLIRIFAIVALVLPLMSCATAKAIKGPDGTDHQLISCESIEYCYEKATEVCGGKYKIVNNTSEVGSTPQVITTTTRLLVKCEAN